MSQMSEEEKVSSVDQQEALLQSFGSQGGQDDDDGFLRPVPPQAVVPPSLAAEIARRKKTAAAGRAPEVVPQAPALGAAGSRNGIVDKAIGVGEWLGEGMGLAKEADTVAQTWAKPLPDLVNGIGDAAGGNVQVATDYLMEKYAPIQEGIQNGAVVTDSINKYINPIPKITLGEIGGTNIKLGVATKDIVGTAIDVAKIGQFHKNEGADANATGIDERKAFAAQQQEFRRQIQARRGTAGLIEEATPRDEAGRPLPYDPVSATVQNQLESERKRAALKSFQNLARMGASSGRLAKAQGTKGVRANNEYSMETTAYLNDAEFTPRPKLGFWDKADADVYAPTTRKQDEKAEKARQEKWFKLSKASSTPIKPLFDKDMQPTAERGTRPSNMTAYQRYAGKDAKDGIPESLGGLMPGMKMKPKDERPDEGYREDLEIGAGTRFGVAAARTLGGAGRLMAGRVNTDRMVRDGRYGGAYATKAAELGLLTGAKAGAGAAQASLIASTGGIAAPLIAAAGAGKELAFHVKGEIGEGMQSAAEGLESRIDPEGKVKEQRNRERYNRHFGYQKPADDPDAPQGPGPQPVEDAGQQPEAGTARVPRGEPLEEIAEAVSDREDGSDGEVASEDLTEQDIASNDVEQSAVANEEVEEAVAQPEDASTEAYEPMFHDPTTRAGDVRERGVHWERQGDRAVIGRQKRTWARAGKDLLWGGATKVAKGLWGGLKGIVTVPYQLAKWGWKGISAVGRGIGSLFSRKAKAPSEANKARQAIEAMQKHADTYKEVPEIDRPQLKVDRLKDLEVMGDLTDEERIKFRTLRSEHAAVFGQRNEFGDEPGRQGGTRQQAKADLAAKPEYARAAETAALREQFAPGRYTPAMSSAELLDVMRTRAQHDLDAQRPLQDGDSQDGGSQDGDSQDGGSQDGGSQDAQDGGSQDGDSQDGGSQDGAIQAVAHQDAARQQQEGNGDLVDQMRNVDRDDDQGDDQVRRSFSSGSFGQAMDAWNQRASADGRGLIYDPDGDWAREDPMPRLRRRSQPSDLSDVPLVEGDQPVAVGGGADGDGNVADLQGEQPIWPDRDGESAQEPEGEGGMLRMSGASVEDFR